MPNWCSNSLTLTAASKEEADELHKHFEDQEAEDWTFFGFFVPEEWEQGDWFWSRVEAWGTKWDANLISVDWVDDLNVVMILTQHGVLQSVYTMLLQTKVGEWLLLIMSLVWVLLVAS